MRKRAVVEKYLKGWKQGSADQILSALAAGCTIIESHGPKYHGHSEVQRWIEKWNHAGNRVTKWEITSFYDCSSSAAVFEWDFACWADGKDHQFLGVSIIEFDKGKISSMHEYRMTKNPYSAFDAK